MNCVFYGSVYSMNGVFYGSVYSLNGVFYGSVYSINKININTSDTCDTLIFILLSILYSFQSPSFVQLICLRMLFFPL